jgi:hypothetical protein
MKHGEKLRRSITDVEMIEGGIALGVIVRISEFAETGTYPSRRPFGKDV